MGFKQTIISGIVGVALACLLCVPIVSLAGESRGFTVRDLAGNEVGSEFDYDGDGLADRLDTDKDGKPDAMDLNHDGKPDRGLAKMGKASAVDDRKGDPAKSNSKSDAISDASKDAVRKAVLALTAAKPKPQPEEAEDPEADAEDEEEALKNSPIPDDAIVGIKKLKYGHIDVPTEKYIATIGEQARYIGQKDGIPGSILIAEAIAEKNRTGSLLSLSKTYTVHGEYLEECSQGFIDAYAQAGGSSLASCSSYTEALAELESVGVISAWEASALSDTIKKFDLGRYDKPLSYAVAGSRMDEESKEARALLYRDYVNLERIATSYIGTVYVWGGSTAATGFDCSGLVQWTYANAMGIGLPRTTYVQQYVGDSVPLDVDKLRMGDLLFFHDEGEGTHHVAMYLADGYYIHAPHQGTVVQVTSMDEYAPSFARRVVSFE